MKAMTKDLRQGDEILAVGIVKKLTNLGNTCIIELQTGSEVPNDKVEFHSQVEWFIDRGRDNAATA